MPTNIMTTGTSAVDSSDVVVAAGSTLTVALKDAAGPDLGTGVKVFIQLKDDTGQYFTIARLDRSRASTVLSAGTYRFSRPAGVSVGVFSG